MLVVKQPSCGEKFSANRRVVFYVAEIYNVTGLINESTFHSVCNKNMFKLLQGGHEGLQYLTVRRDIIEGK